MNSPFGRDPAAGIAFRGRGRRLNGSRSQSASRDDQTSEQAAEETPTYSNSNEGAGRGGVAFRGRGYRLGGR